MLIQGNRYIFHTSSIQKLMKEGSSIALPKGSLNVTFSTFYNLDYLGQYRLFLSLLANLIHVSSTETSQI